MGGVAGAARGVEPNPAGREVGAQVGGQVAGGAVVGGDDQGGTLGEAAVVLEQRRQQQRAQHRRDAHGDGLAGRGGVAGASGERMDALVLERQVYEGAN